MGLLAVIRDFDRYNQESVKQDDTEMTLAPMIDKSIAVLDWTTMTNVDVYNLWRTVVFIRRSKRDKYVCVKCREGWVAVSDIYYHNKKVMRPIDFYNGLLSRPGVHKFI